MVEELDCDVLASEESHQAVELAGGGGRALSQEGASHHPLATAGEDDEMVAGELGEALQVVGGSPLLSPSEMGLAESPGKPAVAGRVSRQEDEMAPARVWGSRPGGGRPALGEGHLCAIDGGEACLPGGLGEADHPVEALVVGESEARETEADGLGHELFGMGGPVQKTEARVAVELGIGHPPEATATERTSVRLK
jgi:hypothetical protein